ncbi:MAG: exodeoxyribonuclease VII large subunit, partial [Acidobacteriota bacterium]|nr:exodeoxyribonuclease VII large subunit [Acidobacteriota bacterium]
APTPSAAAEILICTRESLLERIAGNRAKATQALRYRLLSCGRDLHQKGTERAATLIHRTIAKRAQTVDDLEYRLRSVQRRTIDTQRRRLADLRQRLQATDLRLRFAHDRRQEELLRQRIVKQMQTRLWEARRRYESLHLHMTQLSPLTVLSRGYAIVEDAERKVLLSAGDVGVGEHVRIRLHRGKLDAVVEGTRHE